MNEAARTDLVNRVSVIVMEEAPADGPQTLWHGMTNMPPRKVSEPEAITRLWGYVYGVTAGLAQQDFGDLPSDELTELVSGVAVEVFKGTVLVDLEFIRLLETERIDPDLMARETIEAIEAKLTELEKVA